MDGHTIEDIYPLSAIQQGILFHTLTVPSQYFSRSWTALPDDLEPSVFETAVRMLASRHAVLRTSFHYDNLREPLQVVHRNVQLPIRYLDWRTRGDEEQASALAALLVDDVNQGFDLRTPPLVRFTIVRRGEQRWSMLWSRHHILLDAWSITILNRELRECYQALRRGDTPDLPPPVPFRNYIEWLAMQDRTEAERYWRARLRTLRAPTPVPGSHMDPGVVHRRVRLVNYRHSVPAERTSGLRRFAARERLTMSTLVQAAWVLLLARYTGQPEIVVGLTVAGRPPSLQGAESIVGPLINTIPARVRIDEDLPVLDWLREVQRDQVEMREFDYVSLIDLQRWSSVGPGMPLFNQLFVFQNVPVDRAREGDPHPVKEPAAAFDDQSNYPLALVVSFDRRLHFRVSFDQNTTREDVMADLLQRLELVLAAIVADPSVPCRRLPLLSARERRLIETDTALPELNAPFQFHS